MKPKAALLLFLCLTLFMVYFPFVQSSPSYEDFTTYTEVDPNNHINLVGTTHIDSTVQRNEDAYLYKDKGADYFGDFDHKLDFKANDYSSTAISIIWMLSDEIDDWYGLWTSNKKNIVIQEEKFHAFGSRKVTIYAMPKPSPYYDESIALSVDTWYYLRIVKSGTAWNVGIYSTANLRDAGDGTDGDVDNLGLTLTADHKYRYIFACNTWNNSYNYQSDVDIEKLDLGEVEYTVTFYNNTGGIFRVDNATITNGTENSYISGTVLELASLPQNSSYTFQIFMWTENNATINPYNFTVSQNMTIWCYFSVVEGGYGGFVFLAFGLLLGLVVGVLVFVSKK